MILPHQIVLVVNYETRRVEGAYTPGNLGPTEFVLVERRAGEWALRALWDEDPKRLTGEAERLVTQYVADCLSDNATTRGGDHG